MLSPVLYTSQISNISAKSVVNYSDYINYETLWEGYIQNIVLPTLNKSNLETVRFIICESCPEPKNGIHPHSNYIFNPKNQSLTLPQDKYLDQIFKGIKCSNQIHPLKRNQALADLAADNKGAVVILDILPSHGLILKSTNRKKVAGNYLNTTDYQKLIDLIKQIIAVKPKITFHAVFAVPPLLLVSRLGHFLDLQINHTFPGISINWCWPHLNINTGQGFAPSWRALYENVNNGF